MNRVFAELEAGESGQFIVPPRIIPCPVGDELQAHHAAHRPVQAKDHVTRSGVTGRGSSVALRPIRRLRIHARINPRFTLLSYMLFLPKLMFG